MNSWDRGWNANGVQVWGAVEGPYQFIKVNPETSDIHVNAVARRLTGDFNSFKQAKKDPKNFLPLRFNNCHIKLENSNFPANSRAILIDQTANTEKLKFNRVRFLVVTKPEGEFSDFDAKTSNWALKDGDKYHGLCDKPVEASTDGGDY